MVTRGRLLGYYYRRGNLGRYANEPGANPAVHLTHIQWFIEHRPDCEVLAMPEGRIDPGEIPWVTHSEYVRLKSLWLQAIDRHPRDASVLVNAAQSCCGYTDKRKAINMFVGALELRPGDSHIAADLGWQLAVTILGIEGLRDGRFVLAPRPVESGLTASAWAQAMVEASQNHHVIGQAASTLGSYSMRPEMRAGLREHYRAMAVRWLLRAQRMDPANPAWREWESHFRHDSR